LISPILIRNIIQIKKKIQTKKHKTMANTVVGVFESAFKAEQACFELKEKGFREENIDVSRKTGTEHPGYETEHKTDNITRFFNSLFGYNNEESRRYSKYAEKGSLVTVHAQSPEEAEFAAEILDKYGDIETGPESKEYDESQHEHGFTGAAAAGVTGTGDYSVSGDYTVTGKSADDDIARRNRYGENKNISHSEKEFGYSGSPIGDKAAPVNDYNKGEILPAEGETVPVDKGSKTIPVIEEKMNINRDEVTGETVRLRSRIFDVPVEENLRLREEKVFVERKPADRPATPEDLKTFKEGAIEATEHQEIPVVGKEARVVEEVTIRKEIDEKMETVRGTVRRQDVDVERKSKERESDTTKEE
jgi:stress response protein YsnF